MKRLEDVLKGLNLGRDVLCDDKLRKRVSKFRELQLDTIIELRRLESRISELEKVAVVKQQKQTQQAQKKPVTEERLKRSNQRNILNMSVQMLGEEDFELAKNTALFLVDTFDGSKENGGMNRVVAMINSNGQMIGHIRKMSITKTGELEFSIPVLKSASVVGTVDIALDEKLKAALIKMYDKHYEKSNIKERNVEEDGSKGERSESTCEEPVELRDQVCDAGEGTTESETSGDPGSSSGESDTSSTEGGVAEPRRFSAETFKESVKLILKSIRDIPYTGDNIGYRD